MPPIAEQAARLNFEIVGDLTRCPEEERNRREQIYTDAAQNTYYLVRGILTIVAADGSVI